MKCATRNCFLRLTVVVARLRGDGRVTATDLAAECGVCIKTIHRDLEFLRDAGFRLEYDPQHSGWNWDETGPKPWWLGGDVRGLEHPFAHARREVQVCSDRSAGQDYGRRTGTETPENQARGPVAERKS